MALYAASCELGSITHSGAGKEDSGAGNYQSSYGIRSSTYSASNIATEWIGTEQGLGAFTTFYHRGFIASGGTPYASGRTVLQYDNSGGTPVFRLQLTGTNTLQAQYWNGSAWTNIGSTYFLDSTPLNKYDLKIVCGASGSFEFYCTSNMSIEPPLVLSGSASMTSVTNIDRIKAFSTSTSGTLTLNARHSEWIWGDEPTIGHRYAFAAPTGNGTDTAGSGAFGDVDEAVTTDTDLSTLAANGDAETYTHSAMTLPAGTVKAVQVEARVRNVAGGAQNVKARLRVGGTAYDQASNYSGIGTPFSAYRARWATNPAGGSWTPTTAGQTSNEFGLLAQT